MKVPGPTLKLLLVKTTKGLFGYAAFYRQSHMLVTENGTSVGFIWKITSVSG